MKHISHGRDTVTKIMIYLFIANPPNFLLCPAERLSSGMQSHTTRPSIDGPLQIPSSLFSHKE